MLVQNAIVILVCCCVSIHRFEVPLLSSRQYKQAIVLDLALRET